MGKIRRSEKRKQLALFEKKELFIDGVNKQSDRNPCYHCGETKLPLVWSGLLESVVHETCHDKFLKKRRRSK